MAESPAPMAWFLALGRLATRFCCSAEGGMLQQPKYQINYASPNMAEQDALRLSQALGVSLAAMREALPGLAQEA